MSTDSSNVPSSQSPISEPRGKRVNAIANVIATGFTGIFLYAIPPILASVMLIVGISLSGLSGASAEALFTDSSLGQFSYILLTEIIVLSLLLWFIKLAGENWRTIGVLGRPNLKTIGYVLVGLAVYYSAYIVTVFAVSVLIPSLDLNQEQEIGFDRTGQEGLLWIFLSLVVLAPVAEELVFRGYLYTRFRRSLPFVWSALVVSVLFGVMHLQFGSGNPLLWVAAIDTFILSLVLVYQREKTGSVWASTLTHMAKNFVAFFLIFIIGIA